MVKCLKDIKECRSTQVPLYDFKTNSRVEGEFTVIHPSDVVLLEGILVFYYKEVRDLFDMKLFVDTDADTRLARRGQLLFLLKILHKIGTKHDRLRLYWLFRNILNDTIFLNFDETNAIGGKRKNAGNVFLYLACQSYCQNLGRSKILCNNPIQPNFDSTANTACYVCCKLILTFVQFL